MHIITFDPQTPPRLGRAPIRGRFLGKSDTFLLQGSTDTVFCPNQRLSIKQKQFWDNYSGTSTIYTNDGWAESTTPSATTKSCPWIILEHFTIVWVNTTPFPEHDHKNLPKQPSTPVMGEHFKVTNVLVGLLIVPSVVFINIHYRFFFFIIILSMFQGSI